MLPLIYPLLAIFGFKKANDGGPMGLTQLASLICCTLMTFMTTRSLMKVPIKSPPFLIMMLVCCVCSCSSSVTLANDTKKRIEALTSKEE
jgi:uncharacterized membrane protein